MADFNSNLETQNKDIILIKDKEAIKRAIANIILTQKFSVPSDPDFGCDLESILFEIMDTITFNYIRQMIRIEIEKREPRVRIENLYFNENRDLGQLIIEVEYIILLSNEIDSSIVKIDLG